ncbi:protein SHORTAGE IN CHIASMATA 1 homolog isoform X2 [Dioscorea cayenensis subsp. rotundata]|uniref:Protein SHORTAGE IN CHIASMATA 1 homolog isoform X2 n=1 Tax=Dioscorea cayennensis subsp. rotundata TaxID=55577 RepID=A0AB40CFP0_DIOCR|nr:protein SHORTAGE IN CHIASMATA 1 homolog isoform X2 [Dioscorea cayenensis subsp. rotundata]
MRSRFLSTDFFSSDDQTLAHFHPLSLSPPSLASLDHCVGPVSSFVDLDPNHGLCFDVDRFPIEDALCEFLLDVFPGFLVSGEEDRCGFSVDHEIELSEKLEVWLCEKGEAGMSLISRSDALGIGLEKRFQFEVLEVDLPLRDCESSRVGNEAGLRFWIPDIEIPLVMVNAGVIQAAIRITYPHGVAKSIFSVEEMPVTSNADEDPNALKDGSSLLYGMVKHPIKLPCFEVNEFDLELKASLSMEETLSIMLPKFEHWQGTHGDELVLNAKEFLGSTNMDTLGHLSGYTPLEQCVEEEPIIFDPILDMDLLNFFGNILLEKGPAIFPITSDGDHYSNLPCSVHFQEVQILDSSHTLQIFGSLPTAKVFEMSEPMFKDDMEPLQSVYESIVSSELALVDDTFRSLPEPILCDLKLMKSLIVIIGDLLCALKPHSFTFGDGIYLDWHPLLEGTCNQEICLTHMNALEEVLSLGEVSEFQPSDGLAIPIDFDLLDDSPENLIKFQREKIHNEHQHIACELTDAKPASTQKLKDQFNRNKTKDQISKPNRDKVSLLFENMPQHSDLNYFLDVRRGTAISEDKIMKREPSSKDSPPVVIFENPSATNTSSKTNLQQWVTEVHQISLSDHILGLLDYIRQIYLTVFEENTAIRNKISLLIGSDFEHLSLSQKKLVELIRNTTASESSSDHKDETITTCVVLYAIKHLAYLLCFFGVHPAHLYLNHLMKNIGSPNAALRSVKSVIDNAWWKVEKELTESHPSLSFIEGIVRSNTLQNGNKILIVADRLFWFSLNRKLASTKIKCHEIKEGQILMSQLDYLNDGEFTLAALEALQHSHCLLISHENISTSFPFNKFSIILEYGGPSTSSKISSMSPTMDELPQLHFLEVKVDNQVFPMEFYEGYDVTLHLKSKMIFEGEISFLAAIMDSSDALYAAAASLDMNLQLFCSYTSETTDEIILSSIRNATKLNRSIYPAMPESETIGESFFTKFPSINPLSAHAILSSGGMLVEFLEWSHERRIRAIGKYHIPEHCMSLFSSVCRYGELGESKSVMTECSSIDSDSSSGKFQSDRKRHKMAIDSRTCSMSFDKCIETLNQLTDDSAEKAQTSHPYQPRYFCMSRVQGNNCRVQPPMFGSLVHDIEGHDYINENSVAEVIDQNSSFFGEQFSKNPEIGTFLSKQQARNEAAAESSQPHRSMFGATVHPTFPTAAEINKWDILKVQNQDLKDKVCDRSSLGFKKDFTVEDQGHYQNDNLLPRHVFRSSVNVNIKPPYSGSSCLNTIHSQRADKGSNWTLELLNRVKEKRRMHQQSLQCNKSPNLISVLNNKEKHPISRSPSIIDSYKSKASIKRSPSIIDSYRFQGSNKAKNVAKQKCNKGTKTHLFNSEEKNDALLITPTWTPVDKRARQNLSFTRNGNEKQSKLVWRSRNSPNIGYNVRKRYRDEG